MPTEEENYDYALELRHDEEAKERVIKNTDLFIEVLAHKSDFDLAPHIGFNLAMAVVSNNPVWWEHEALAQIPPEGIAELITFDNSHKVAHSLCLADPVAAKALFDELAYWSQKGRL